MIKTVEETLEEMGSIALEKLINPIHRELIKDTLINARQCEALVEDLPEELAALEAAYDEELEASLIEDTIQRMTTEIAKDALKRDAQCASLFNWKLREVRGSYGKLKDKCYR